MSQRKQHYSNGNASHNITKLLFLNGWAQKQGREGTRYTEGIQKSNAERHLCKMAQEEPEV